MFPPRAGPGPLRGERGVLASGPAGKSRGFSLTTLFCPGNAHVDTVFSYPALISERGAKHSPPHSSLIKQDFVPKSGPCPPVPAGRPVRGGARGSRQGPHEPVTQLDPAPRPGTVTTQTGWGPPPRGPSPHGRNKGPPPQDCHHTDRMGPPASGPSAHGWNKGPPPRGCHHMDRTGPPAPGPSAHGRDNGPFPQRPGPSGVLAGSLRPQGGAFCVP